MTLEDLADLMLPEIEANLRIQVQRLDQPATRDFYDMLAYHMGWIGENIAGGTSGKRLRPLLALLVNSACGGNWLHAVPAAAALELVHNFSLVHDDIQDHSEMRHGRPTVWRKWGAPLAINVGDALFTLSGRAILDLRQTYPSDLVMEASQLLHDTCLDITRGQFLDMTYERRTDVGVEDYWPMISGKTSALLGSCGHIGALLGGADHDRQDAFRSFAYRLGLAFQIQDDILGIWGDEVATGKSAASDLVSGKKSLPVLFGLSRHGRFAEAWNHGQISPEHVESLAKILADEGAHEFALSAARNETRKAMEALEQAGPSNSAGMPLRTLASRLLDRQQ